MLDVGIRWEKKCLWVVRLWVSKILLIISHSCLDNEFLIGYFFEMYVLIISHNIIT